MALIATSYADPDYQKWLKEKQQTQANATNAVQTTFGQAGSSITNMTGAASSGVTAAQQAAANAQAAQAANAQQVRLINTAGQGVTEAAGRVSGIAGGMAQDTAQARADAETLRSRASDMWAQASPYATMGADIVNLNPNATGLAGAFGNYFRSLSPDSLVSFAASDAQRSIENTRGQLVRTLSGMGVTPGSAAYGAALARSKQYESALLAGVKTRAHLLGIEKQGEAIQQGMQMALQSGELGNQIAQASVQASQAAGAASGRAADIEAARGGLEAQAGGLQSRAGELAATAAGVTTQGAQAVTAAQQGVAGAYANLANAQQAAAEYYAAQSSSMLGLLQSGGSTALSALFAP